MRTPETAASHDVLALLGLEDEFIHVGTGVRRRPRLRARARDVSSCPRVLALVRHMQAHLAPPAARSGEAWADHALVVRRHRTVDDADGGRRRGEEIGRSWSHRSEHGEITGRTRSGHAWRRTINNPHVTDLGLWGNLLIGRHGMGISWTSRHDPEDVPLHDALLLDCDLERVPPPGWREAVIAHLCGEPPPTPPGGRSGAGARADALDFPPACEHLGRASPSERLGVISPVLRACASISGETGVELRPFILATGGRGFWLHLFLDGMIAIREARALANLISERSGLEFCSGGHQVGCSPRLPFSIHHDADSIATYVDNDTGELDPTIVTRLARSGDANELLRRLGIRSEGAAIAHLVGRELDAGLDGILRAAPASHTRPAGGCGDAGAGAAGMETAHPRSTHHVGVSYSGDPGHRAPPSSPSSAITPTVTSSDSPPSTTGGLNSRGGDGETNSGRQDALTTPSSRPVSSSNTPSHSPHSTTGGLNSREGDGETDSGRRDALTTPSSRPPSSPLSPMVTSSHSPPSTAGGLNSRRTWTLPRILSDLEAGVAPVVASRAEDHLPERIPAGRTQALLIQTNALRNCMAGLRREGVTDYHVAAFDLCLPRLVGGDVQRRGRDLWRRITCYHRRMEAGDLRHHSEPVGITREEWERCHALAGDVVGRISGRGRRPSVAALREVLAVIIVASGRTGTLTTTQDRLLIHLAWRPPGLPHHDGRMRAGRRRLSGMLRLLEGDGLIERVARGCHLGDRGRRPSVYRVHWERWWGLERAGRGGEGAPTAERDSGSVGTATSSSTPAGHAVRF